MHLLRASTGALRGRLIGAQLQACIACRNRRLNPQFNSLMNRNISIIIIPLQQSHRRLSVVHHSPALPPGAYLHDPRPQARRCHTITHHTSHITAVRDGRGWSACSAGTVRGGGRGGLGHRVHVLPAVPAQGHHTTPHHTTSHHPTPHHTTPHHTPSHHTT